MEKERHEETRPAADDPRRDTPNEGATGHHPGEQDSGNEETESEQSFPASDPPANY